MKVLHIITGLETGGAEMVLYNLLSKLDRTSYQCEVLSLIPIGPVGKKIESLGIPIRSLGMQRGIANPLYILKLADYLKRKKPDIVQTWMYHANVIGGIAARLASISPIIWSIHNTNLDPKKTKRSTLLTDRACTYLSHWIPRKIIFVSEASVRAHVQKGYQKKKIVLIHNGFDTNVFQPNSVAYQMIRKELGIKDNTILIGLFARFDPQKDHYNFVQAASLLHKKYPNVHFVLCGTGITWKNRVLAEWIEQGGIHSNSHLLGERTDMPYLQASLDIATSSSYGESFPMVIGEAMASGVPCVVTDVGDSALIVGENGRVVPPQNPYALAEAWVSLIALSSQERKELGIKARKHIENQFSLSVMADKYINLYKQFIVS